MPLGFVEIDYYIARRTSEGDNERVPVRGVQVGRFAIRHATEHEEAIAAPNSELAPWRVDHTPTGMMVSAFDNFEDAYATADDLSRFSKSDPASKDRARAAAQVGDSVRMWIKEINRPWDESQEPPKYIPYREWFAKHRGKDWAPRRRRKAGSLFR